MQSTDTLNLLDDSFDLPVAIAPAAVQAAEFTGAATARRALGPLRARLVATEAELTVLADAWNRLAGAVPFRRFEWIESWWRHYRLPGWRLFTLVVEDASGRPAAIAPWYVAPTSSGGRVVRWLGSGEVCSEYLTVLTRTGDEAAAAAALADWLSSEGSDDWDLLLLEAVESGEPATTALSTEFARRGLTVHARPALNCWRCELPGDWNEFLSAPFQTAARPRQAIDPQEF